MMKQKKRNQPDVFCPIMQVHLFFFFYSHLHFFSPTRNCPEPSRREGEKKIWEVEKKREEGERNPEEIPPFPSLSCSILWIILPSSWGIHANLPSFLPSFLSTRVFRISKFPDIPGVNFFLKRRKNKSRLCSKTCSKMMTVKRLTKSVIFAKKKKKKKISLNKYYFLFLGAQLEIQLRHC